MNKIEFLEICQRMRYGMVEDLDVSTAASWVLAGLRRITDDPTTSLQHYEAAGAASVLITQLLLTRRLVASRDV